VYRKIDAESGPAELRGTVIIKAREMDGQGVRGRKPGVKNKAFNYI
jgi:hypothetical protein